MTRYPIILVHGVALREMKYFKAFGKIEESLKNEGYDVYTAKTDGFGTIENNAEQLREIILGILEKTGKEKINIIAHSKGGLDTKYMIKNLGMADKTASVTTLCTPHRGSEIATQIWRLPLWIKRIIAFFINTFYKIVGDQNPDSMRVCEQLKKNKDEEAQISEDIYIQSYSTKITHGGDCLLMGVPMMIYHRIDGEENDGMVSVESSKYGNYRGDCIDEDVSHTQIVDFLAKRKNRRKILAFYIGLCNELKDMGY